MKKAFTLAEMLITLTIIGVIAALTVPTLVKKYRNHVFQQKFKQAYSMLNSAYRQAVRDPDFTTFGGKNPNGDAPPVLMKYLKVKKQCSAARCGINWRPSNTHTGSGLGGNHSYQLENGMVIFFSYRPYIIVDLNGKEKPNIVGIDTFYFCHHLNNYSTNTYYEKGHDDGLYPCGHPETYEAGSHPCDPSLKSNPDQNSDCTFKAFKDPDYFKNLP